MVVNLQTVVAFVRFPRVIDLLTVGNVLTFPVSPGAPHNLRVVETRARSVVLNWTPGSSGRAPILSYTIQYNSDSFYNPQSAQWKRQLVVQNAHLVWNLLPLEVPNLKPYSDYRFRVIATNKIGSSSPSNASDPVKTLEAGKQSHGRFHVALIHIFFFF